MDPSDVCISDYKYGFSPDLLRDKVAFVTGGGSGIGFTITEILMRHGCRVVIASRNEERLKLAAQKLTAATGQRCLTVKMDVRKPEEIQAAMDKTLSEYGRLDILVNNAAGNFLSLAASLSSNAFRTVMEIDAHGVFNCSKAAYEKYFQAHGGVIINISATLYYRGNMMQMHAGAAKAAIDAMTRHMAVEWGAQGVRVISIAPGPIDNTEGMRRLAGDMTSELTQHIPIQRLGSKADIAHAVVFLVSRLGGYVTGTTVVVDGGDWLTSPNGAVHFGQIMQRMNKSRI